MLPPNEVIAQLAAPIPHQLGKDGQEGERTVWRIVFAGNDQDGVSVHFPREQQRSRNGF